ncbi:MAG: dihydrolipoamide acetyltransferase family protein [Acidobacteriota bacterium]|jgi:pyruvate dehydrogenase E2 component (dihydrolipoamide acetyltransferase)
MSEEFKLPDIGEGLAEGEIVKWLVAVGDAVEEDQPLVEVMTDKATVEIPSPRAGTVEALSAAEGDIVKIGTTILVFGDGAAQTDKPDADMASADEIEQARDVARAERQAAEAPAGERKPWEAPPVPGGAVAPAARRLAGELGVDVSRVPGSGRGGLVTKDDVRAFAEGGALAAKPEAVAAAPAPATPEAAQVAEAPAPEPQPKPATETARPAAVPAGAEERIPLRGLRRTISERMVIAKTTVPHYTYVEEVDMTEIVALREQAKPKAAGRGIKLTYLPFIIRALVAALEDHPYLNASLDSEANEIVLKHYYNIGIATATERGLMVPVIHGADARDLFGLAAEITRLSDAARDGSIGLDDLHGGTFTITSTGNIGGFLATPVINVPEVAILGITAIRERPVVRDSEIVIRQMCNLSLSCDHRVVDGAIAALFMRDFVRLLEDPKLQLLAGL